MKSLAPTKRRRADRLLACLCLLALCSVGCSTQETKTPVSSASTPTAPGNVTEENLSGLWTGTTSTGGLVGMAGMTRSIKLVLRQEGDKITLYFSAQGYDVNLLLAKKDDDHATGSLMGMWWGAVLLVYLPQWSTSISSHLNLGTGVSAYLATIIFGLVLIVAMIMAPTGIQGGLRWGWHRITSIVPRLGLGNTP